MTNSNPTQCELVMQYIKTHGSITQLDAMLDLGVMRLASRISELKKRGEPIKVEMKTVYNRRQEKCLIAEYSLAE